ncbi:MULTISPECIES: signal peptidase II [Streptomyces]|uniref:Lipoprotein signal peptidase n=1 Tax=Streptomyces venezuelae TaxID=54571 RepID=A0A5P2B8R1_STRVZ|nr:signal peptidase II [Streptomyces venezuelae]MYY83006.1 signal peptidase II [Streptomyces sp. SID335]MYZ15022.1 signal peptidase II [Streptomyces sp. SID337]NDZ87206.1 signal peptidase II [Streptomyces sp. SID10115]NDZ98677.1 signal peptidase II [Streptomyces sp. SID10116]NEB50160.1 signal peptidase II [Streptomyces sp. SID339]
MAEAERIIGTPDIPEAAGDGPEQSGPDSEETAAARQDGQRQAESESEDAGTGDGGSAGKGKRKIAVLFAVAVVAYAFDLISKMIVVAKLEHHEPIDLIGDWLRLSAIRNAGAAFGFGEAFTVIFTCIAAAVIVVIARLARKLYSLPWAIALGLLLGGALGNLTDRLFRAPGVFEGAVVDFIAPKGFAVFNLADSAIVCGGILIVLLSFRGLDPDGTVHKD